MIISGKNSVFEVLNSNKTVNKVCIANYMHDDFCKKIIEKCKERKIRFDFVDKKVLDKQSTHHQGYLAEVTEFEYCELEDILNNKKGENNFKNIFIQDISQETVIRFYKCCRRRCLGERRLKNTLALLNQMIKYFQNLGIIDRTCNFQVKRLTDKNKFSINRIIFEV